MAAALTQDENLKRPEEAGNQHQQVCQPLLFNQASSPLGGFKLSCRRSS